MCQCHHTSAHQQLELVDKRTASHILISRAKHVFQEKKEKNRQRKNQTAIQPKQADFQHQPHAPYPGTCFSGTTELMRHEGQQKAKVNVLL